MKKPAKRNPIAPQLRDARYRPRVTKTAEEREEQKDAWSKKAKHKKKPIDESYIFESFQYGDKVKVSNDALQRILDRADELLKQDEVEAVVRTPNGPDGSIGINIDGKYYNVDPEELSLMMESITDGEYDDIVEWATIQTTSGIAIAASKEEVDLLNKFENRIYNDELDEREQEVARLMVSRGLLNRKKDDKGMFFLKNNEEVRRF